MSRPEWPGGRRRHRGDTPFGAGAVIDGSYRVTGVIGQGGMGQVVEVIRLADSARLALKYCDLTPLGRKRLIREAKILRSIEHPHVLSVMALNLSHDPPFYVMPLARDTLEAELPMRGGDLAWCLGVFRQVCLGVQGLHQAGVIHRDLKPANILRLGDGRYVVADLGAAKREPRDSTILTRTCAILGTLSYLAPEQMMPGGSRHADARTDVYQLGKVFYQMLTKRSPAVVDPISLPPGLTHIVKRATATRPADRYQDVGELLGAVEGYEESARGEEAQSARHVLAALAQQIAELRDVRSRGRELPRAILKALGGLDWLQDDDFLEGFDMVPTRFLTMLAHDSPAHVLALLATYALSLERGIARRHFQYAELVARRMEAIFVSAGDPALKAQALAILLFAAVALNRYAAMTVFKRLLFQIRDTETAVPVAQVLRDHRDDFQEAAPGLNLDRLHPILRGVIYEFDWIETVSF